MEELSKERVKEFSVLSLAFMGDAVFTQFVREKLVKKYDFKSGRLSAMAVKYVSAPAQSAMYEKISLVLNEDESDILRRSRNAHTLSKAKNADMADYKKATALEGLIGYLYLSGQAPRLNEILEICFNAVKT